MYSKSSSDKIKRCPCCGNQYPTEIRDNNTVYVHCDYCGFKTKEYYYTDKQKAIDEWNNSESPWRTGTPTEDGDYLVKLDVEHNVYPYYILKWNKGGWYSHYDMDYPACSQHSVLKWQKIEEKI